MSKLGGIGAEAVGVATGGGAVGAGLAGGGGTAAVGPGVAAGRKKVCSTKMPTLPTATSASTASARLRTMRARSGAGLGPDTVISLRSHARLRNRRWQHHVTTVGAYRGRGA